MDMLSYLLGRKSGGGGGLQVVIVEELPETGQSGILYLVPRQTSETNNVFDEYLYVNDSWELIGTTEIDISGKQDKMQFSTMPIASSTNVGSIIQYVGATGNGYTNGYFYICINNSGTYSWTNISVQQPDTENIADAYSSSSTYDEGDYVSYNGKIYVCNTDISTAEAWTPAHWTETTVMEELGSVNTILDLIVTVDEEEH